MLISLIITTYNWPESLSLVLKSVENQTVHPDCVVIADDGSAVETKKLIEAFKQISELKIIHSWQEDKGFRAAKSRNKAISLSNTDYIILIDGDSILHPKFIEDHKKNSKEGYFVQGSRVLVNERNTNQLVSQNQLFLSLLFKISMFRKNSIHSYFFSKIFSTKSNTLKGIKACNLAFFRKDFISVNGFNNDFEGWGREDSEFIVRFFNNGISRIYLRFNAIQYHLWHPENNRKSLKYNDQLLKNTINKKIKVCKNGINEYL
jgi:glycosyltransferase involved in cell wall biosynthesis